MPISKKKSVRRPTPARRTNAFHSQLAQRMRDIAGESTLKQIGDMTGAHPENVRRYMSSGRISARFLAQFCEAFKVEPKWVLFGRGQAKSRR